MDLFYYKSAHHQSLQIIMFPDTSNTFTHHKSWRQRPRLGMVPENAASEMTVKPQET